MPVLRRGSRKRVRVRLGLCDRGSEFRAIDARDFRRIDLPFAVKAVKVPVRAAEVSSLVRKVMLFDPLLGLRRVMISEMRWRVCGT
jgi:hypothetical protein